MKFSWGIKTNQHLSIFGNLPIMNINMKWFFRLSETLTIGQIRHSFLVLWEKDNGSFFYQQIRFKQMNLLFDKLVVKP